MFQAIQSWRFRRALRRDGRWRSRQMPDATLLETDSSPNDHLYATLERDLIDGMSTEGMAALLSLLLLQAYDDRAEAITFNLKRAELAYTIDGTTRELVPPPALLHADLARAIVRSSKPMAGGGRRLTTWLRGGKTHLKVEISGWELVIRGFPGARLQTLS